MPNLKHLKHLTNEKTNFKVTVKENCEKEFLNFCKKNDLYCRQYKLSLLSTRFAVKDERDKFAAIDDIIKKFEDMPTVVLSNGLQDLS